MISAIALAAMVAGLAWDLAEISQIYALTQHQDDTVSRTAADLTQQVATEERRAGAAEADVVILRQALQDAAMSRARQHNTMPAIIDVRQRNESLKKRALELCQNGRFPEALDECLRCYNTLRNRSNYSPADIQDVIFLMQMLGSHYPPALVALSSLRDEAVSDFHIHPDSRVSAITIALMNEQLHEGQKTVELYDSLPVAHPGRQALAVVARDTLVAAQRYEDALIGKPFDAMLRDLDRSMRYPVTQHAIDSTIMNIEILTGVGRLDDARILTERLLARDSSDTTRAAIDYHVQRAVSKRKP